MKWQSAEVANKLKEQYVVNAVQFIQHCTHLLTETATPQLVHKYYD